MEYIIVALILGVIYVAYCLDEAANKRRDNGDQWR